MTTAERAAVAALVAAAKYFVPPMDLSCTQEELDLQLAVQRAQQLPGYSATENGPYSGDPIALLARQCVADVLKHQEAAWEIVDGNIRQFINPPTP